MELINGTPFVPLNQRTGPLSNADRQKIKYLLELKQLNPEITNHQIAEVFNTINSPNKIKMYGILRFLKVNTVGWNHIAAMRDAISYPTVKTTFNKNNIHNFMRAYNVKSEKITNKNIGEVRTEFNDSIPAIRLYIWGRIVLGSSHQGAMASLRQIKNKNLVVSKIAYAP